MNESTTPASKVEMIQSTLMRLDDFVFFLVEFFCCRRCCLDRSIHQMKVSSHYEHPNRGSIIPTEKKIQKCDKYDDFFVCSFVLFLSLSAARVRPTKSSISSVDACPVQLRPRAVKYSPCSFAAPFLRCGSIGSDVDVGMLACVGGRGVGSEVGGGEGIVAQLEASNKEIPYA